MRTLTDISGSILPVSYFWGELFENNDFVGNTQNKNDDFAVNSIYEKLLNDKLSVNPGYLYENTAVQMLTANGMNCSTAHL